MTPTIVRRAPVSTIEPVEVEVRAERGTAALAGREVESDDCKLLRITSPTLFVSSSAGALSFLRTPICCAIAAAPGSFAGVLPGLASYCDRRRMTGSASADAVHPISSWHEALYETST
jgi:hypothetical protein